MKKLAEKISVFKCVMYLDKLCKDYNLNFDDYQNQLFYKYLWFRNHYEGEDCLLFTIQEDGKVGADYLYEELNVEALNAKSYCVTSTREFLETCGWDVDDAIKQFEEWARKGYEEMSKYIKDIDEW